MTSQHYYRQMSSPSCPSSPQRKRRCFSSPSFVNLSTGNIPSDCVVENKLTFIWYVDPSTQNLGEPHPLLEYPQTTILENVQVLEKTRSLDIELPSRICGDKGFPNINLALAYKVHVGTLDPTLKIPIQQQNCGPVPIGQLEVSVTPSAGGTPKSKAYHILGIGNPLASTFHDQNANTAKVQLEVTNDYGLPLMTVELEFNNVSMDYLLEVNHRTYAFPKDATTVTVNYLPLYAEEVKKLCVL